jgi:hypothetical protein
MLMEAATPLELTCFKIAPEKRRSIEQSLRSAVPVGFLARHAGFVVTSRYHFVLAHYLAKRYLH